MASEIRVDTSKNASGLCTVSYTNTGAVVSGIVTANSFSGPVSSATGDFSIADAIVHTGDTDTKIRFPGANQITFETGGVQRLELNNYGTYQPATVPLAFLATSGDSPNIKSGGTNANDLLFTAGNTERLRITSAGKVGIGTDTTTAKLEITDAIGTTGEEILLKLQGRATKNVYLDINADANRRGVIRFKSAGTDKWSIGRGDSDELSDSSFFIATGSSGGNTAKLVINSDGDVEIGGNLKTNNLSGRNLIVNGACMIAQRGSSSSSVGYQTVDRFKLGAGGTDETPQQYQGALTSNDSGPWAAGFRKSYYIVNGNQTGGAGAADYV